MPLFLRIQPLLHFTFDLGQVLGELAVFLTQHTQLNGQLVQLGLVVLAGRLASFLLGGLLHAFHLFNELSVALF